MSLTREACSASGAKIVAKKKSLIVRMMVRFSERPQLFVEFRQPAALLRIGELAFGEKFHTGIRDVRRVNRVVSRDVISAHDAMQHHVLRFAREGHHAYALDHQITV